MLEQLVHRVESRLFDLLRGNIAPRDEQTQRQEEIAAQEDQFEAAKQRLEELQAQIKGHEEAVAQLPGLIESSFRRGKAAQALRQALELDRLRRELEEARAELPRLEQTCWSLSFRLRQLRRLDRETRKPRAGNPRQRPKSEGRG